ncbi:MAG: hypothetical protein LBU90_00620 [Bacteroidales bacterium]|jgi:hypothetical protein|nr:hypothetical protein [Bacteroidales bacterium]
MRTIFQRIFIHAGIFLLLLSALYALRIYGGVNFDVSKIVVFLALASVINVSAEIFLLFLLRSGDPKSKLMKVFFCHSAKFLCYLAMALLGSRFIENRGFFVVFLLFLYLFYAFVEFLFVRNSTEAK